MIVTYPLNNVTYSAEDAELYNSARTSGVYATDDNLEYSLTGAMQITIGVGLAWIQNSRFSGKVVATNLRWHFRLMRQRLLSTELTE